MIDLYDNWFNKNQIHLYQQYGDCWLIIDSEKLLVVASYPLEKVNESISHYYKNNNFVHQKCSKELVGYTSFCYSPLIQYFGK
jgi:hypothetical protein